MQKLPRALALATVALLLLLPALAAAQGGASTVYISRTDTGQILRVNPATGIPSTVLTMAGARFEDLILGADNLLVACDPTNGRIIRMDPDPATNPSGNFEVVYQAPAAGGLQSPQCGWFSHKGDLFVSSQAAGSGVWRITGLSTIPLGGAIPAPVRIIGSSILGTGFAGGGLTQNHNGNLLLVDRPGGRLLSSPFNTQFASASVLLSGLREPVGVARRSNGDLFVSASDGLYVRRTDGSSAKCLNYSGNTRPNHLAFTADDTLYVTVTSNNSASLERINIASCPAASTTILEFRNPDHRGAEFRGVALPPTSRTVTKGPFTGFQLYGFGGHAYFLTANNCRATIRATPAAPAALQTLINATGVPGRPIPYLGEGGFGMIYQLTAVSPPGCQPDLDGFFRHHIGGFTERLANPRLVRCEDEGALCGLITMEGFYPVSTLFPDDAVLGGKGNTFSRYFMGEFDLTGVSTERGQFCGFRTPLTQSPPETPAVFSSGDTIPVKFLLAAATPGASCASGPFLTEGVQALLSVARILDAAGKPVFEPIRVQASGSSNPNDPPLFRNDNPTKQNIYNLSLEGYLPGTYSLSILFLTDNEAAQDTLFRVVP